MSFLLSGICNMTSLIITSIFIIIEYVFQYIFAFVIHTIENPFHLLITIFVILIIYYYSVTYDKTVDASEIRYLRKTPRKNEKTSYKANMEWIDESELPPVYPNGWIALMESKDLAIGQSVSITALGETFVIFRGKTGKSFVLDAYCPHLGANLGVCGKVYDDCIQCPFHGWIFSGHDGSCVKIPYIDKVPEFAKTKHWLSIERNGFIYVWYHADGEQPSWILPVIPEIEQGLWTYKGRIQIAANCHIQEMSENVVDFSHFEYLHQATVFHDLHPDNWRNILKIVYSGFVWTVNPSPNQHTITSKLTVHISFCGILLPWTKFTVDLKQLGPAIFHVYYNCIFGRILHTSCITPEDSLRNKVVHYFYTSNRFIQIFVYIIQMLIEDMIERDILIWINKKYLKTPLLISEDKLIPKFRKWYSQFYSENSTKLNKKTLNW